jgi:hypothetical protein
MAPQWFTINAGGAGDIGVSARQFAVVDVDRVRFGRMNIGISAQEISKVNTLGGIEIFGDEIFGDMSYFAYAADGSSVSLNGGFSITGARNFSEAFVAGAWGERFFRGQIARQAHAALRCP